MKKRHVFGFVVAGLLAGFVSHAVAQSATAYSSSAIGVIKKTVPAGKMVLMSIPLDDPESTSAEIPFLQLPFLSSLPNGSAVNIWDTTNSKWVIANKVVGKWRGAATNESLHVGQSIFVKNGGGSEVTLMLTGEVPADADISISLAGANQLQACANPYPVPFDFATSALASNAVNGSSVNFWDPNAGVAGEWVLANKVVGKWRGTGAAYTVQPAEGFMMKYGGSTAAGGTWTVSKPYVWPENED